AWRSAYETRYKEFGFFSGSLRPAGVGRFGQNPGNPYVCAFAGWSGIKEKTCLNIVKYLNTKRKNENFWNQTRFDALPVGGVGLLR
ncbi:MAG: hypothetical protein K2O66_07055, partial [Bacteroidales bacterium]|nr:hypothetical protein [Bacteroidales bacterium]